MPGDAGSISIQEVADKALWFCWGCGKVYRFKDCAAACCKAKGRKK